MTPAQPAIPLRDSGMRSVALVRLRLGLGDLLCSAPALRELKAFRPDLRVTLITWPEVAPVVERLGYVDEFLPFPGYETIPDRPAGVGRLDPATWAPFLAAARERRFDLAVQAYGDRSAANEVTAALGARLVGGFAPTGWQPPTGTEQLHLRYPVTEHEVRRHLLLFERLGMPLHAGSARMEFAVSPAEESVHRSLLRAHGLRPDAYAVLHPGASAETRRWPVESYAEVARRLAADGLAVVVTGSAAERPLVSRLAAASPDVELVDLCERTDLAGLALLLRDAAVLVGNDTGTAHLAAAVGGRSVTIFQPGDPVRWAHRRRLSRALTPDVPCAPCPHLECPIDFRCSRATTPDRVLATVADLLPGA